MNFWKSSPPVVQVEPHGRSPGSSGMAFAEFQIRIAVLNDYPALGIPVTGAVK